ncbi:MAG: ABC transporter substrate-binding protein, partial [Lentisphaerae bacterium]
YKANKFNFERLRFKFYGMADTAFQAFMKGELDILGINKAEIWVKKATGEVFRRNWVIKQKIYNHSPIGFQGWAMNMRKPPFDDVRVRKAICHLIDRRKMNATMMFNQYFLHRSYYEDLYDKDHPCPNKLVEFDVAAARKLLAEAGWKPNPQTGILEKNGQPFVIEFLIRSPDAKRFLAHFREALNKVGIRLAVVSKDWSAWIKDMDQFNFMMTWAAWGAGVKKDPEPMWASKEGKRQGGNNITGFSDAKVDALIEKQKTIFDIAQRHEIVRQIDQIVYNQYPYALLWNLNYHRILYWNKFGTPPTVFSKYGDIDSAIVYWWLDQDAEADLREARKNGETLPGRPLEVHFDECFNPKKN